MQIVSSTSTCIHNTVDHVLPYESHTDNQAWLSSLYAAAYSLFRVFNQTSETRYSMSSKDHVILARASRDL